MLVICGCPSYWSKLLTSLVSGWFGPAYWLNNGTPFTATPIGPSGVGWCVLASCGSSGMWNSIVCSAMWFGFCCQLGLVPLYASQRGSVVGKYGLLWSGTAWAWITTCAPSIQRRTAEVKCA